MIVTFVRSLMFAVVFYGLSVVWVVLGAPLGLIGYAPLRWCVQSWGWMHRIAAYVLLGQKTVVRGVRPTGPVLYIFKHESMFETIDILCMFRAPVLAAKQELLDIPGWGWLARRYGLIGVEREAGARALRHLRTQARACVEAGRPLIFFPEGTRVPHGTRAPLRAGFAALYQLLGLPVVPVAVDSGRISPRNSFMKRAGTITYVFGEVIPAGLPRAEAEARVIDAINILNPVAPQDAQS